MPGQDHAGAGVTTTPYQHIVNAAAEQMAAGVVRPDVAEAARRAGVAPGAATAIFADGEALRQAVIDALLQRVLVSATAGLTAADPDDPVEQLRGMMHAMARHFQTDPDGCAILITQNLNLPYHSETYRYWKSLARVGHGLVERAAAAGRMSAGLTTDLVMSLGQTLIAGVLYQSITMREGGRRPPLAAEAAAMHLRQIDTFLHCVFGGHGAGGSPC